MNTKKIKSTFHNAASAQDYMSIFLNVSRARSLPFSKKAMINTLEHIWGYFKRNASQTEKQIFFRQLELIKQMDTDYFYTMPTVVADCFVFIRQLLTTYPNTYLLNSTIVCPNLKWNEVSIKKQSLQVEINFYSNHL